MKRRRFLMFICVLLFLILGSALVWLSSLFIRDEEKEEAPIVIVENSTETNLLNDVEAETEMETENASNSEEDEPSVITECVTNETISIKETHTHNWIAQTKTVTYQEKGHYETKVLKEAYEENVYAWRTFCNKCGEDITDLNDEALTIHSAILCESGYHNDYVVINTVLHEAIIEQVWVVDIPAYSEIVDAGYQCECGATK